MDQPESTPGQEPAHDILAAEAFAVPGPDPGLRQRDRVRLPEDPSGIPEAHDVLAAEEFAMPAPRPGSRPAGGGARAALAASTQSPLRTAVGAAAAVLGALFLRRRRGG
ncbi:MAG TPA: hypothetical protein VKU35_02750 [Candidatus Limnocylindria bacterium]|nr:hypothetical protein [Candidatus Limnocylindria bacterium]